MDRPPLQIIQYPHPTLRYKSKPIKRVDAELVQIIREMLDLMYQANGIGLAANQVGLPLRMFVVNTAGKAGEGEELVFLNPVLSRPKGNEEGEEGCLSLPELYGPVMRPKQITVNAYNLKGEEIRATFDGLLARVVQHENDHLDGVLFVDRLSPTARADVDGTLDEFELAFQSRRETGAIPDDATIAARRDEWERRYC
jgi:peptide deformylase